MPELIDKQASMRAICDGCFKSRAVDLELRCRGTCNVIDILQQQPTIEAEPVRHGRWIPVEDALPEIKEFHISDTVLCYCDSGALAIARLEENGFGKVGFNCEEDDGYGYYSAGKVLYWMPLPEIPEPPEKE